MEAPVNNSGWGRKAPLTLEDMMSGKNCLICTEPQHCDCLCATCEAARNQINTDFIILVKNQKGDSWYLHDASFYTFEDAQVFARQCIDSDVFYSVSIGECNPANDNPPTFNYTYTVR